MTSCPTKVTHRQHTFVASSCLAPCRLKHTWRRLLLRCRAPTHAHLQLAALLLHAPPGSTHAWRNGDHIDGRACRVMAHQPQYWPPEATSMQNSAIPAPVLTTSRPAPLLHRAGQMPRRCALPRAVPSVCCVCWAVRRLCLAARRPARAHLPVASLKMHHAADHGISQTGHVASVVAHMARCRPAFPPWMTRTCAPRSFSAWWQHWLAQIEADVQLLQVWAQLKKRTGNIMVAAQLQDAMLALRYLVYCLGHRL